MRLRSRDSGRGAQSSARGRGGSREREWSRGDASKDGKDRSRAEPERRRDPEPSAPLQLGGLGRLLFIGVVVAFLVLLARAIAKNFLRDRTPDDPSPEAPAEKEAAPEEATPRGPIETDVERLLARARAAAARGDHARALDDVYAALLRRLDGDGLIEIHPSRTNGDYARRLRERPDLHGPVRGIFADVERVQFGTEPPSDRIFRSVLERVIPLVSRALGVVLFCFGLAAALSCSPRAPEAAEGDGRGALSPSGTQALIEMLDQRGIKATHRTQPISKLDRPLTLVLLPDAEIDEAGFAHLLAWVKDKGGRLVLAGIPAVPKEIDLYAAEDGETEARVTVERRAPYGDFSLAIPPGLKLTRRSDGADPADGVILRRGDSVFAVERSMGEGRVAAFADGRLFTNIALTVGDNAAFLGQFFRTSPQTNVELYDEWTGAGAATPLDSVAKAELLPVLLQAFLLLALLLLWKGIPFARLRDPAERRRRSFADHARAMGTAYARSRASRHVLGVYTAWAMERLRERVHRAGRQGMIPLAETIAARTGRSEADVMNVLLEASSARDEAAPPSLRPSTRGGKGGGARAQDVASDLALIRQIEGFLAATGGQTGPRKRT